MRCRNCGHTDRFVLLVELAVLARRSAGFPERGRSRFSDPDWGLSLECASCASTDVAGDPAALLTERTG